MTPLIVLAALAFFAFACWRAYRSLQLQKRDPQAWQKEQDFADLRRRQRQTALGKVTERGVEIVKGWVRKEEAAGIDLGSDGDGDGAGRQHGDRHRADRCL